MTEIKTRPCEHCQGLGRVPEDPGVTVDELRAARRRELRAKPGRPEFEARIARHEAGRTAQRAQG